MELQVGCTGWGYKEWEGTFYPKTVKQKDWLLHYSSIFDIVEVNSSFYHTIPRHMALKWNNDTPKHFRFSLKFPQKITHDNRLDFEKSKEILNEFFLGLEPLKEKINVLVLQLPPSLGFEEAKKNLEKLGKHFPHYCRYAIEGRQESWFSEESLKFLRENNYCLVWSEIPMVENPAPITADFVYLRLIGDRNLVQDVYDHKVRDQTKVLEKWADKISKLDQNKIKLSWILLNNHLEGFAPSSAKTMRMILGLPEIDFRDKRQKSVFDFS